MMYWLKVAALASLVVFLWTGSYLLFVTAQSEKHVVARADATFSAADAAIQNVNSATAQVGASFTSAAISVSQTEKDVNKVTAQLSGVVSGLQQTVALINAPCVPGPCGTIFDLSKTLNTTRLTLGQVEIAANTFDKNESNFYLQEDQLYSDSEGAVKNLNTILTDPDLTGTIHNSNVITANLGQTTGDFQAKFHDFLYPPPCKGFRCDLKKGYEAVKTASYFSEPAYWGWALFSQFKP
jgi:hypothetical protein